jgi:hypothetical protein
MARDDYRTAIADLEATPEQACLIAVHALAWRAGPVLLPVALLVGLVLLLTGVVDAPLAALLPAAAIVGPVLLAMVLTFPVAFVAGIQSFSRGTATENQRRFGTSPGTVYVYYGWRYAFRGRRRAWGALTVAEKRLANPRRAAAYWPES